MSFFPHAYGERSGEIKLAKEEEEEEKNLFIIKQTLNNPCEQDGPQQSDQQLQPFDAANARLLWDVFF